ncbi:MAG TPA: hypothetical protein VMZ28_11840, partial [Kofleriaceae bacterium]|nr:hypothetical protein [Kofleriaceae bacterium]
MRLTLALLLVAACGGARPGPSTPPAGSLAAPSAVAPAAGGALGELDFPVSGSPACQAHFDTGMLAMHSFQYEVAHEEFAAARAADPGCAMAAWGDAMAHDHPIWHERDVPAGRAALASVTAEDALTPRERDYLAAARALYGADDEKAAGAAWLEAARRMREEHPDDDEVALQYVLALLRSYGYSPKHVREQVEAGSIALGILARRAHHPGAAHYVIHAFDSREHAILALPAALTYARIAPAAGHAQHMPSHTFVHLGMWRRAVPSNQRAIAAAVAWAKAHGQTASAYDWHSYSWLVAAHLELGQHGTARKLIDDARALVVAATDDSAGMRYDFADMVSIYAVHTGRWDDAEALVAPVLAPLPDEAKDGAGPVACAAHAPGGGGQARPPVGLSARIIAFTVAAEAAIRRGDRRAAEARTADLARVRRQMKAWDGFMPPEHFARL